MFRIYPAMAFTNIRKNRRMYVPYILSSAATILMYYIVCSMGYNRDLKELWGGDIIQSYMNMGRVIIALFALIFLLYVNSFLMKRRRSEFGLYNILGMEKKHICRVVFFETLYVFLASYILGVVAGILLDKLMYMVVLRMLDAVIPMGFYISTPAMTSSFVLFGIISLLILLNSVRQIRKAKPVELLQSDRTGEREPKARWVMAVLGCVCLTAGYLIAVLTKNPIAAFMMFFLAVILVIAGTYLLFTSGSIALLKLLKKNKGYYYKTKHFVSVSSMMYRMKKNAVGLANICILSTMVLVILSATLNMYVGAEDSIQKRYPAEFMITAVADDPATDKAVDILKSAITEHGLEKENERTFTDLSYSAVYDQDSDSFDTDPGKYSDLMAASAYNRISTLMFITLDDYNRVTGAHEKISCSSDVLLYTDSRADDDMKKIDIFGESLRVAGRLNSFPETGVALANVTTTYFMVVKDQTVLDSLFRKGGEAYGKNNSYFRLHYMTDIKGAATEDQDRIMAVYDDVNGRKGELNGYFDCRMQQADAYLVDFAGLYFIGIFLGLLFIMATVLIMYYKQITEGYEDRERFVIMQNVGMSQREVKRSINSQILTVFFLPLVTAGVHICFAFPFVYKIMTLMGLYDMKLFAICTACVFAGFALFYTIVYRLTARLYYSIVKK